MDPINKETGVISINPGLKDVLLEFTINCLLDHPDNVVPYAANFFKNKVDKANTLIIREYEEEEVSEEMSEMEVYQPPAEAIRKRTGVVYSERYDPEKEKDKDFHPVTYPKTEEQKEKILKEMRKCVLFAALKEEQMEAIANVMFPKIVKEGEIVIEEGSPGNDYYVIESGVYNAWRLGTESKIAFAQNLIQTYDNTGSFGELALMYNTPRAATVKAVTRGALWVMNRMMFRKMVLRLDYEKRLNYAFYIGNVPLLQVLTPYERMELADTLVEKNYDAGEVIIRQGDIADGMYFIKSGEVEVTMSQGEGGVVLEMKKLLPGDYFGELALITKKPRAATLTAVKSSVVAFLDRETFERLLGPCMDMLHREAMAYEKEREKLFKLSEPSIMEKIPE